MSKQSGKQKASKRVVEDKQLIPTKYETPVLILLLLVLLVVFLNKGIFGNKVFIAPDINASQGLDPFVNQAKHEGVFPLWIPYAFSGMPSFASLLTTGARWYDFVLDAWLDLDRALSYALINPDIGWVLVYYFLFGIGMFWLLRRFNLTKFAAFFGATAAIFSTFIINWIMVGHNTKIAAIAFFPFIFLLVIELGRRFRWIYVVALAVALHLEFQSTHIQMIFYSYFAIGIYLIYMFVRNLVKKEKVVGTLRSAGVLVIASVIALLMSSDLYFSTYEYSKYSIRGSSPIVQTAEDKTQTGGGLDYQYATNWSFAPEEMAIFFVPSFYGFGDITYNGPLSNNQEVHPNTYFGPEPFMVASPYMGVIVLLFAVIGFWRNRKNPLVIASLVIIFISLLISFGREFPVLYDLMFNYFPYFNKFRSPNMILVLVQIFVPVLAAFGVDAVAKARENSDSALAKRMMTSTIVFGVLILLALLLQGALQDYYRGVIQSQGKQVQDALFTLLFNNMSGDLYASLIICLITCGTIYFFINRKITALIGGGILSLLLIIDLWRVDYLPMQLYDRKTQQEQFVTPDYIQFVKSDSSLCRTLLLDRGQPATSLELATYLVQGANGYSGAKLRVYQDMIDVVGLTNPNLMRLLGIKYVIMDKPDPSLGKIVFKGSRIVEENDNTLPRAFFVDNYRVESGLVILNSIRTGAFDPGKTVMFEKDPGLKVDPTDTGCRVTFTDYELQSMKMEATTSGNNLLLLSDVYYPAGWKAYIDGHPAQIYKADYFLRALLVPKGNHEIELKFEPRMYSLGRGLTLASNGLVILLLVSTLPGVIAKRRKRVEPAAAA
ncbi:MAG TPA: YfhO family protein [Candidatus Kryptonia bacterium]